MKRAASTTFLKGWKEDPPGEFKQLMSMKWPKRMRDESDEEIEKADKDERPLKRIKLATLSGHSMHGNDAPFLPKIPSPVMRHQLAGSSQNGLERKTHDKSDIDSDDATLFHGSQSEKSSSKVIIKKEAASDDDTLSGQKNSRSLQPMLPKAGVQKHEANVNTSDDEVLPHGGAKEEPLRLLSKPKGKHLQRSDGVDIVKNPAIMRQPAL
ncbi:hypothetical protein IW262DRAFT_1462491 [Armillaria fumosa]|nr:hypothetical protein IW262DRAFT_1462491 [Armillaria fumosa]